MTDVPGPLGRVVKRGFLVLLVSRAGVTALQLISFALLAAFLNPSGLAIYTTAIAFITLFETATSLGFRGVVLRESAQRPEEEGALVANLLYVRLAMGVLAYGLLAVVVVVSGYDRANREAALVAGVYLVLVAFESFMIPLEVRVRVGWIAIADLAEALVLVVGTVILGVLGVETLAFLWLYVGANAVNLVIVTTVTLFVRPIRWRPRLAVWRTLIVPAMQLGAAELLIRLYFHLDLLILARFKPGHEVGQYGAAVRFLSSFTILQVLVMMVLGPVLARSVVEGYGALRRRYRRSIHLLTLIAMPAAVGGAMTASRVVPALPGFAEFAGAGRALAILAPATVLIFIGSVTSNVLLNAHLQRSLVWVSLVGLASVVVLNAALIPAFSYIGASIATTVTEVIIVGATLMLVHRRLGLTPDSARFARVLRATAVLVVALVPGYFLHPFVQVVVGLLAYVVALRPTGALAWEDIIERPEEGARTVVVDGAWARAPMATWRSLRGAAMCEIADATAVPWWLPAVARLAGCASVVLLEPSVSRPLWRYFVDDAAAVR